MEREDLGALFARITRKLIEAERPLLEAQGLTMWGYAVLAHLAQHPAGTQKALAEAIGYDKTRLIALLDDLQHEGLVGREPDPADRRAHIVRLTSVGTRRHAACQSAIREMEEVFLEELGSTERRALLAVLPRLATLH